MSTLSTNKLWAAVLGVLLSTTVWISTVWAGSPAYEASSGLIYVGTFVLFYDSKGPLSYQAATPRDLAKDAVLLGEVHGDSCQHGVSIPIIFSASDRFSVSGAKGDGSYQKALRDLKEKHPDVEGIYDVKVDKYQFSVLLGLYQRNCTEVAALGFKLPNHGGTPESSFK